MNLQHVENLFRRFKGEEVTVKTISGGVYQGVVGEITNDYASLNIKIDEGEADRVFILLHTIESVLPARKV
ncbi:MAG TPA: hypothetical protein VK619_00880 [Pyrinomonadaceae bacterium]|nr:hypothetical protein [Pyrinomonadaceae bacterium]